MARGGHHVPFGYARRTECRLSGLESLACSSAWGHLGPMDTAWVGVVGTAAGAMIGLGGGVIQNRGNYSKWRNETRLNAYMNFLSATESYGHAYQSLLDAWAINDDVYAGRAMVRLAEENEKLSYSIGAVRLAGPKELATNGASVALAGQQLFNWLKLGPAEANNETKIPTNEQNSMYVTMLTLLSDFVDKAQQFLDEPASHTGQHLMRRPFRARGTSSTE